VNSVTVCTGGSEPWRGSLSDRVLIAENRCAAFFDCDTGTRKRDRHCSGAGRRSIVPPFHPPGYLDTGCRRSTFLAAESKGSKGTLRRGFFCRSRSAAKLLH